MFYWNVAIPIHLCRDGMAHKIQNICYLALYRKSWLVPVIGVPNGVRVSSYLGDILQ